MGTAKTQEGNIIGEVQLIFGIAKKGFYGNISGEKPRGMGEKPFGREGGR